MRKDLERYNYLKYNQKPHSETPNKGFIDFLYHHSTLDYPVADEQRAWDELAIKIANKKKKSNTYWLKIAASVTLLLSVSIAVYFIDFESEQLQVASTDETITVTFSDGSIGTLNENSRFSYPEKFGKERRVNFSGEAYFDIKKSEKPFIVNANGLDVKVLGTAFNLITSEKEVTLYVDRGLVAFSKDGVETKIAAGIEAIFYKESKKVEIKEKPSSNIMSWRNGNFKFENTPLNEALKDLEEYYEVNFKLSNENLKNCRISASFNKKSLSEVLSLLEDILDVKTKLKDKVAKISGKGC